MQYTLLEHSSFNPVIKMWSSDLYYLRFSPAQEGALDVFYDEGFSADEVSEMKETMEDVTETRSAKLVFIHRKDRQHLPIVKFLSSTDVEFYLPLDRNSFLVELHFPYLKILPRPDENDFEVAFYSVFSHLPSRDDSEIIFENPDLYFPDPSTEILGEYPNYLRR